MLVGEIFFIIIAIWAPCIVCDRWDDRETRRFVEEYIPKLQRSLRRADDDSDENYIRPKTITKNNRHYEVHLIKLNSVNGLKRHNLIVKEKSDDNPLIYVINPVETKIPQAFVSQKEFKAILSDRVKKQRNEVYKKGDPLLPVNSTYWTKITWSKPSLRSMKFPYQHLFTRRQHITKPVYTTKVTKEPNMDKNVSLRSEIPYIHYFLRTGKSTANIRKTKYLRTNKTRKVKTNKTKNLRSNRTSKVKTKARYLRSNRTSKAIRNKAISLKNNGTVKAKTIHLRNNRSIKTKRNKKILQNFSIKPMVQAVSHISKNDQNITVTEEISKAKIIDKQINETIERQTTEGMTTEKPTTDSELPPTKSEVASTSQVFTTKEQSAEEITLEKPTNSDLTTEKLKADAETKINTAKTDTENTDDSKNERETKKISTDSEITTEKLTTEDKTTIEPTHHETVNTQHSEEEKESMPTEKAAETGVWTGVVSSMAGANDNTTKSNDNTDSNTESVNTENQVDLSTDQSKVEETTVRKPLPFRTTAVKRSTTKARTATTRTRLSRPLVFMGEMGNGNSWN